MNKFLLTFLAGIFVLPTTFIAQTDALDNTSKPLVVVSKEKTVDMLSATPLVNKLNGDLLFFDKNESQEQSDKIKKYEKIILIGGQDSLKDSSFALDDSQTKERISGSDRYETSLSVLKYHEKLDSVKKVNLISGKSYADASIVASKDIPVVLIDESKNNEINMKVKSELDRLSTYNLVIGGVDIVNDAQKDFFKADRLSGKDRYETSTLFSGENENGYIESSDISFINNISDAHKAFSEGKGFLIKKYELRDGDLVFDGLQYAQMPEDNKILLSGSETSNRLYKNLNSLIDAIKSGRCQKTHNIYDMNLPFSISFDDFTMKLAFPSNYKDTYLYFSLYEGSEHLGYFKIDFDEKMDKNEYNDSKLAKSIYDDIKNITENKFIDRYFVK
ncbi:cell wall-binding repeat-containing protein [Peptostreptococcus faecalis]|uniref:cell wall-binding repeat-containing protein n=1 Tax=Peptostreptococcus faecalis TaxID=2045015 RepID=UPI000C7C46C2|nr:cell wall-binding repeat-containing protein [Peptostreptococcus faecalis]